MRRRTLAAIGWALMLVLSLAAGLPARAAAVSGLPPMLDDDPYSTIMNQELSVAAPGFLGNDNDHGDGYLSGFQITGQAANGTFTPAADGSFTYTPNTGFTGVESIAYQVPWPGGDPSGANIIITVNQRLQLVDDAYETIAGLPLTIPAPGFLDNDTDNGDGVLDSFTIVTDVANGQLDLGTGGAFTYTPASGFTGGDAFTYQVIDGSYTAQATVTISVPGGPPFSLADDQFDAFKNIGIGIYATQLFANDTVYVSGDSLVLTAVSDPDHGSFVTELPDGFAYIPEEDYVGLVSFTYTAALASDPSATETANVTITVHDTPLVAVDDQAELDGYLQPLAIDVLANDTITLRDGLIESVGSAPSLGSATLNDDGTITYTLDLTWIGTEADPVQNCWTWSPISSDSFTYNLEDSMTQTSSATVYVTFFAELCIGHDQPLFDADSFPPDNDNCPLATNEDQLDTDGDGFGNACDIPRPSDGDYDDDGVADAVDNCPTVQNTSQANVDADHFGDRCDVALTSPANEHDIDNDTSGGSTSDDNTVTRLPNTGHVPGDAAAGTSYAALSIALSLFMIAGATLVVTKRSPRLS